MAEKFRFFDAVEDENGVYDREYNAQEFTDYFKALVTTGVMKGAGNQLAVSANGSNMITRVDTGVAFILGRYYENDSFKELTHDTETIGNSRIDRIVVRMDLSTEARYVKSFIKKGVPSTNPIPPALTQTANYYEISLAQVRIVGGQTFIASDAVTDERGTDVICPWAGSNILPNFNEDGLQELIDRQFSDENGRIKYFDGDLNELRTTGFYNGAAAWGMLNAPPGYSSSYMIQVYALGGYSGGSVIQIAYDTNNAMSPWYRTGFASGSWNSWSRASNASGTNIYVDPVNGTDANTHGWSTGTNACKTVNFALQRIPKINGNEIAINLAAGTYPAINIQDYVGARINFVGAGASTIVESIRAATMDDLGIRNLALTRGLDFRSVKNFYVYGVTKTTVYATHGVYLLGSRGSIWSSTFSNCTGSSGVKADNFSEVMLDTIAGTGNAIGLDADVSLIRRRSSTITGTTPTKVLNGGQIL